MAEQSKLMRSRGDFSYRIVWQKGQNFVARIENLVTGVSCLICKNVLPGERESVVSNGIFMKQVKSELHIV
jgi:hypothetical protein